jgi:hypothetical protein
MAHQQLQIKRRQLSSAKLGVYIVENYHLSYYSSIENWLGFYKCAAPPLAIIYPRPQLAKRVQKVLFPAI